MKEGKRKVLAFYWATLLGIIAFIVLAQKMDAHDLITLCQFFFLYTGIITSGFFGFNFGEHFTNALSQKYMGPNAPALKPEETK